MPTTKRKLKTERARLSACLSRYPAPVRLVARDVLSGIDAAVLAARIHPAVKARIVEGVAELEKMLGVVR
jgi:hypothetical protein